MADFIKVCGENDLVENSGVAALIDDQQLALFYIDSQVYITSNTDPIREAEVMSRGMVGDRDGELFVASPLHKECYSLISGVCLDKEGYSLSIFPGKIEDGFVWVDMHAKV
ncbi:nitrite reductase small subunit NirD [Thiomicrorhabdus sp.]|uniref:nitrite reductase small subunit NirD n=1 Tax=Thiomicrorhabdus sp. TaxID=2039724 RepID=UPI0029C6736D|nr:nitrite reductase small subunit NirD [Thiomicrorhabdus sp.]